MHNAAFAALGLNWRYLAFEVRAEDLRAAIAGAKAMQFSGLNLTVPHKLLAMEMVDELDESAKTWGAVNTVRFEARDGDGQWQPLHHFSEPLPGEIRSQGFNTDSDGFGPFIARGFGPGTGGRESIVARNGRGRAGGGFEAGGGKCVRIVSGGFREGQGRGGGAGNPQTASAGESSDRFSKGPVDLLLNATPLGLKAGDPSPLDGKQFPLRQARAVYDMIYSPAETTLLKAAKAAGCKTANGLGMLLYQGAKAFEIWTGQPAPVDVMRRALEQNIYGK